MVGGSTGSGKSTIVNAIIGTPTTRAGVIRPRGRVGVDIESRERGTDPLRIARRYFAPEETAALAALDEALRHDAFLRLWCAKEAVLKAHGGGIAFGLHKPVFDVGGEGLRMLRCDPALGQVGDWSLHMLEPEAGFVAVLASTD